MLCLHLNKYVTWLEADETISYLLLMPEVLECTGLLNNKGLYYCLFSWDEIGFNKIKIGKHCMNHWNSFRKSIMNRVGRNVT